MKGYREWVEDEVHHILDNQGVSMEDLDDASIQAIYDQAYESYQEMLADYGDQQHERRRDSV